MTGSFHDKAGLEHRRVVVNSVGRDSNILAKFLEDYADLVVEQPIRAAAILADLLEARADLSVGCRDILCRKEWLFILRQQPDTAITRIAKSELCTFLSSTFSPSISGLWINAIGEEISDIPEEKLDLAGTHGVIRSRIVSILALTATALLGVPLGFFALRGWLSSPKLIGSGDQPYEQGTDRQKPDQTSSDNQLIEPMDSQFRSGWPLNNDPQANEDQEANRQGSTDLPIRNKAYAGSFIGGHYDIARRSRPLSWDDIYQHIEDGIIMPSDLTINDGSIQAAHWVQSFDLKKDILMIRLRTRHQYADTTCAAMLRNYQEHYTQADSRRPIVILESGRHAGKDSAAGFLPICSLSSSGTFSVLQSN